MKKKVYLLGRDYTNWATDDDYFFAQKVLKEIVNLVENAEQAEVIHAINWYPLLKLEKHLLKEKIIIAHIPHDVRHMATQPDYLRVAAHVDHWIVPSSKADFYAKYFLPNHQYIPYGINKDLFYKIKDSQKQALKQKYKVPTDKYLIGSFQRDTEGADLITPKYIKGPDIFFQIVQLVYRKTQNIHVVLAGPRRFWIKKKLQEANIPFTFIGEAIEGDDITQNTLDHQQINELYNLIDLYIVSSRMEGGPKAVLECAACQTKIISTDVGHAQDILSRSQIYANFIEAIHIIFQDIQSGFLNETITENYKKSFNHTLEAIAPSYAKLYKDQQAKITANSSLFKELKQLKSYFWERMVKRNNKNKVSIYFKFHKPPWGGGNQFLLALTHALKKKQWLVKHTLKGIFKTLLFNSFHIDLDTAKKINTSNKLIIHRIDGPTYLIRDKDKELDDNIFNLNKQIVDVSVFQSVWSLFTTLEMGYAPVNPILIKNGSDHSIFNTVGKTSFSRERKIRLVSTSWSNNPRKGGAIYKWLDENLDWEKFEYTFVGRASEELKNIRLIEPVSSEELAAILKQHDIYITASDNDPCSNALIEALSCGLPAIYLNKGGHPEIVGHGGLGFDNKEEIPQLIETIVSHYERFQNLILTHGIDYVADQYIKCFKLAY